MNGAVRELPVVHARGTYMGEAADLVVLDDEVNPLVLRLSRGSSDEVPTLARVVRISYACSGGDGAETRRSPLERALLESGRADVYGIYFDFDSDRIREESGPTLREIADLLRRHPDWGLAISGHTDEIGNDRYNLELSARRAAAAKTALTGMKGIGEGRLTTRAPEKPVPRIGTTPRRVGPATAGSSSCGGDPFPAIPGRAVSSRTSPAATRSSQRWCPA